MDVAIISHLNYIRKLVGQEKLTDVPDSVKEEFEGVEGFIDDEK